MTTEKLPDDLGTKERTLVMRGFGPRPTHLSPRDRYLDLRTPVFLGVLVTSLVALMTFTALHLVPIARPPLGLKSALMEAARLMLYAVTLGNAHLGPWMSQTTNDLAQMGLIFRTTLAAFAGLGVGGWIVMQQKPTVGYRHVSGIQLRRGWEAEAEARKQSQGLCGHYEPFLNLHPDLPLPKNHWTKHAIFLGGVGSGKTQILWPIVDQLVKGHRKLFLYDVKGDFTQGLVADRNPRATIVSPWDARSGVWDIALELAHDRQLIQAFATAFIPEQGGSSSAFWTGAGRTVMAGILECQYALFGTAWGWTQLAESLALPAADIKGLFELVKSDYARVLSQADLAVIDQALAVIGDDPNSATAQSIFATIAAASRSMAILSAAWGVADSFAIERQRKAKRKRWFTMHEWVHADERQLGPKKRLIVRQGADRDTTGKIIRALVDVAATHIVSPTLPDDEHGRTLAFVIDEWPTLGKVESLPSLIDKGRSKGCVCILAAQDTNQIQLAYGPEQSKALISMVGTHVICRMAMGESRKALAQNFGTRKVLVYGASETSSPSGTSQSGSWKEEAWAVVPDTHLSSEVGLDLTNPKRPLIKAIVSLGSDPLLLRWPIFQAPKIGQADCPAAWTLRTNLDAIDHQRRSSVKVAVALGQKKSTGDGGGGTDRETAADREPESSALPFGLPDFLR
ncbi:type IV secretion system DNA-binding domain-containing protein [Pseudomarimonas arenosa]|uniref:Type IV secretion system DNA-binding domain-containing protein n=1 Tax=Pseudomarimonas arenosa TaxID=2774145 RepID=A0AAW3ZQU8_9GAMM|nr:type IV secretion system DNA-binding domain-containing protein [Pseudomarimonas arenosa]MBD8527290.1 type IV secretion system DNA-binding domain-containing protein [Pseudomarimonas arenosa]